MRKIIIVILVLFLFADNVLAYDLKAVLKKEEGGKITYILKNNGVSPVAVKYIDFVDSRRSGYWFFLYNPKSKEIQHGWGTVFSSPEMRAVNPSVSILMPNKSLSESYDYDELTKYFLSVPDCFYLVVVYRDHTDEIARNIISNALYLCGSDLPPTSPQF